MKRSFWQTVFSLFAAASLLLVLAIVAAAPLVGDVSVGFTRGGHFSIVHTLTGIELVIPTWGHFATEDIGLGSTFILWILLAIPGIWLLHRRASKPRRFRPAGFPVIEKLLTDKGLSNERPQ